MKNIRNILACSIMAMAMLTTTQSATADWTFLEQHTISTSSEYQQRVEMCFMNVAFDVLNEPGNTANHANRVALANRVLWGEGVPPRAFKLLHILNAALQGSPTPSDGDLEFTVAGQWDTFANALAAQSTP
jgi:hypothetical protein